MGISPPPPPPPPLTKRINHVSNRINADYKNVLKSKVTFGNLSLAQEISRI